MEEMKNDILRKKTHSLKLLQRYVMYFLNVKITMEGNTTMIKMNPMMVLPSQLWRKKQKIPKKKECFRCKKIGHYSNKCEEELPRTINEKKGTILPINKEDSSDKELSSEDECDEKEDESINQETHQNKISTALDDDKTSDDESYEPCNNSNNNNIQEEITGVTDNNTVPILEEEKDPNEYITLEDINITSEMNKSIRLLTETENEEVSES